jgi:DNA processing protein
MSNPKAEQHTSNDSPETVDLLALSLVPGLGPRLTAALLAQFGNAAAVRRLTAEQFRRVPRIGDKLAQQFTEALRSVPLDRELQLVAKHRVRLVPRGGPLYPKVLARLPDAPFLLYCRGTLVDADEQAIAIVGSRQCTAYGRRMAQQIARGLAQAGYTIVSGLALGIDGAAHEGALQAGGRTLAVLAGGLSTIYPPQHLELSCRIEQSGCLLSEAPMTSPPEPNVFAARNRIISGLAQAVVVIEAGDRSGSLITARHALEQGRELFVVPGQADSPHSAGSLQLLRNGARLVRNADDILEDLRGVAPAAPPAVHEEKNIATQEPLAPSPRAVPRLAGDELRIWEALAGGPLPIDELVRRLGIPVAQLTSFLMALEIKRCVRRLPGNYLEQC